MSFHLIILYLACAALGVAHYMALRQEERFLQHIKQLQERAVENNRAYLRLEQRVSLLEKGMKS